VASIVSSIVISKFLHCTILENFNLKWTRIQHGMDLGCWPALEECYVSTMYLLRWDPPFPSRACKPSSIENSKIEKLSALNQQVGKILLFLDVA
jgi:hypothetical protein